MEFVIFEQRGDSCPSRGKSWRHKWRKLDRDFCGEVLELVLVTCVIVAYFK